MRSLLTRFCLLCVAAATMSPAWAAPLEERRWIEVSSQNFTIRSRLGKKDSIELLKRMELLRNIVGLSKTIKAGTGVPTVIYVVKNKKEFVDVGGDSRYEGYFQAGLRENTILMHGMRGDYESSIIQHEYVHHLVNNADGYDYPPWYREGYADYLGAVALRGDTVELFGVQRGRVATLRHYDWLPAEALLDDSAPSGLTEEQISSFYAQSWLLVHYIGSRRAPQPSLRVGLPRYFQARSEGLDAIQAFEAGFGIPVGELNDRLRNYLDVGRYETPQASIDRLLPEFDPVIAKASPATVALGLANVALKIRNLEGAERWYGVATESDSTRARAIAGLGRLRMKREDVEAAEPLFEQAATMAPDDSVVLLDRSNYWLYRAEEAEDLAESDEYLVAAASGYDYLESRGEITPELLVNSSRVMRLQDVNFEKIVTNLEAATEMMPSNVRAHADLAVAYANVGRYEDAVRILRSIRSWGHDEGGISEWATSFLLRLQATPGADP